MGAGTDKDIQSFQKMIQSQTLEFIVTRALRKPALTYSITQLYNHSDMFFYTPDVYAASAAVSHSLTALIQVDSKRLHSSCLSSTCQDRENYKTQVRSNRSATVLLSVGVTINKSTQCVQVCFDRQYKLTCARWPMITCQIVSSSAGLSLPSESKYRFWRAISVCTAC